MRVLIASLNTAIERLLIAEHTRIGAVHTLVRDETLAGGKGVNVARVLNQLAKTSVSSSDANGRASPLQIEPHLVGYLGGATGRLCRELLAAENLDGSWVEIEDATRICEVIVDLSTPENASVYNARGPMIADDERATLHQLYAAEMTKASAVICTGSIPRGLKIDEYAYWIRVARARHVPVILDTHGPALKLAAEAGPDIVKVNRDEFDQIANGDHAGLVLRWQEAGVHCIIVTDGARATRAITPAGGFIVSGPSVEMRSAVGSGDAYCAGLLASLLRHPDAGWQSHLRLAAACGAANTANLMAGLNPDADLDALQRDIVLRSAGLDGLWETAGTDRS